MRFLSFFVAMIGIGYCADSLNITKIFKYNKFLSNTRSLVKYNNYLFVATDYGLRIMDISNINNPILLNYLEKNPKPLRSLKIYGNYLFASSIFGFDVYNISNPTNPTVVFQYTGCCPNDYSI